MMSDSVNAAVDEYRQIMDREITSDRMRIALRSSTADALGGDFAAVRDTEIGCDVLVADVAGHDLGASFHTVMLNYFFNEFSRPWISGIEFFKTLNKMLVNNGRNERIVSALFLRFDLVAMQVEIVSAAHPFMIMFPPGGGFQTPISVYECGFVLGIFDEVEFKRKTLPLSAGQRYILYTDGISGIGRSDTTNGKNSILGESGFQKLGSARLHLPLEKMVDAIWHDVMDFGQGKPTDDMLLLGMEVPGKENVPHV
jgi:serine phosphatase RsbU (regulator of sigma subunit)